MATGKRYYWIKLRDTFLTSDTIDFFMSQPNGANYVVFYQMLCLKTINTEGKLERTIGEVVIPYDVEKLQRDCKWFSADTIRVALGLYKKFGLIYEDQNGTLVLTNHSEMIGSETDYAAQKSNQRQKKLESGHSVDKGVDNVHTDIRDKILDTRYLDNRYLDTREQSINTSSSSSSNRGAEEEEERPNLTTVEAYASNNLCILNAQAYEELVSFKEIFPDEVIKFAIDEANAHGSRQWAYVRSTLRSWMDKKITTLEDAKLSAEKFRKDKTKPEQDDKPKVKWFD